MSVSKLRRRKVHETLDQLVGDGVIEPVTEAMAWWSRTVVVQKANGQIRLGLDPKDLM